MSEWIQVTVHAVKQEADGVKAFELVAVSGEPLPAWEPGAHIDVRAPSGTVRQYSLCGDPLDRHVYRIAILREEGGRGGSTEFHDHVAAGTILQASAPRNLFPLAVECGNYILIAGGIGITPLLPMTRVLRGAGAAWQLHYGGRSSASMAFASELGNCDEVTLVDESVSGRLDIDRILSTATPASVVYCCGPSGLIDAVQRSAARHGIDDVHFERFAAAPSRDLAPCLSPDFEVVLSRTGTSVKVGPGESILSAVLAVVPDFPYSCEAGLCGTCEVRVIEGKPLHADSVLSACEQAKGDRMLICVGSSATQRLVLDL